MLQMTCRMRSRNTPRRSKCCRRMRWPGTTGASAASGSATPAAALDDFTQAIQRAEASARETYPLADFYHNRAFCRRKLADFSGAIDDYSSLSRGTRVTSNPLQALYNRAFCLDALGRRQDALRDYEAALVVEPRNPLGAPQPRRRPGEIRAARGRRRSVRRGRRLRHAAGRRVLTTRAARMHGTAATTRRPVAAFSAALKLDPCHRTARANRAYARRKIGDFVGARRDYTKALPTRRRPSCTTRAPTAPRSWRNSTRRSPIIRKRSGSIRRTPTRAQPRHLV